MNEERWTAVDNYVAQALLPPDPALDAALAANAAAGLPVIDVSPTQGKFLHIIALIQGARRILELGTLGGYSTIWLARALPADGLLMTLEAEAKHASVAQKNIERAGLGRVVQILVGKALELLPDVKTRYPGPFDLIFIDADKPNTPEYFAWALRLSRPGAVILADNVVRKGEVANPDSTDANVQGMRRFMEMLAKETRVTATALQTVGTKGYDGFVMACYLMIASFPALPFAPAR
jgi:predicted O-methyltransferase YrrM